MLCLILRMIKFREPVQENYLFGPPTARSKEETPSVYVTRARKNSTSLCRNMVLTHRQHEKRSYKKPSTRMRARPNSTSSCRKNETQRTSKRFIFAGVKSKCYPCMLFECVREIHEPVQANGPNIHALTIQIEQKNLLTDHSLKLNSRSLCRKKYLTYTLQMASKACMLKCMLCVHVQIS